MGIIVMNIVYSPWILFKQIFSLMQSIKYATDKQNMKQIMLKIQQRI